MMVLYGFFSDMKDFFGKDKSLTSEVFTSSASDKLIEKTYILDEKVNNFINWYKNNMLDGYTKIGKFRVPIELRDFIEKIAVWYELRYPKYEINKILPGSTCDDKNIDDIMFRENPYIKGITRNYLNETKNLDWDLFYCKEAFINSLPSDEQMLLLPPEYPRLVYVYKERFSMYSSNTHFLLDKNGFVEECEEIKTYLPEYTDDQVVGMHIKEVVSLMKERDYLYIPHCSEIDKVLKGMDLETYLREELLNCVMYRIIERGGNRIGPRRAFLFAKEFNRNIDIPMIYGVDLADPGLEFFINEYIKAGGNRELICFAQYFSRDNNNVKLGTITINELIKRRCYNNIISEKDEDNKQKIKTK